jgi:hypothetical protein
MARRVNPACPKRKQRRCWNDRESILAQISDEFAALKLPSLPVETRCVREKLQTPALRRPNRSRCVRKHCSNPLEQAATEVVASGHRQAIIGLTAHARKGDREKFIAGGMDGYLTKPIRPQKLDELLEEYVRRRLAAGPVEVAGGR